MKSISVTKVKEVPQMKLRLGQGRAGLRCKIKMPVSLLISKPFVQVMEKPVEQPKVPVHETSKMHDKIKPVPDSTIPHSSGDDSSSRKVKRKSIQDTSREIPIYPDPVQRPPPKPVKLPMPKLPRSLSDFDAEINLDFKENSLFQEGVICEMYQRPDKSYFQEPQELNSLINTGRLVQEFLPSKLV